MRWSEAYGEKVVASLKRNLGVISRMCKEMNVSRETYYRWYNTKPEFKKAVDEIEDETLDFVESQLLIKIKEGSEKAIFFYLKNKGKGRGYGNTLDLNVSGTIFQAKFGGINEEPDEEPEEGGDG